MGSRKAHLGEEVQVQVYSGYDVWGADPRTPDFSRCIAKSCHPKSIVRPLGVDVMNVHHFERPAAGRRCSSAPVHVLQQALKPRTFECRSATLWHAVVH